MKWSYMFLPLFIAVAPVAEPLKPADPKADVKPFQGVWLISSVVTYQGKVIPDDAKWVFEGDQYTTKIGTEVQEGTVKVDPAKNPKWIDLSVTSGNFKGNTYRGIYKFVDDELVLCFPPGPPGMKPDRPKLLSGNAGGETLMFLKRKKD